MAAYVIDPNGYIYKCWADVGIKGRAIGNLDEGLKNFDIISEFVLGSDKFSDPKCSNCKYIPICDGGCNLYRIKSKKTDSPYEVCQYDDQGMQAFLEEFTLNNIKL
ncbi:SPASM domain-containing protein [Prevotella amnii]